MATSEYGTSPVAVEMFPLTAPVPDERWLNSSPLSDIEAQARTEAQQQGLQWSYSLLGTSAWSRSGEVLITQNQQLHENQQQIAQLEYAARHDELTGLLNKKAWKEDVAERIHSGAAFGVAFMDMNAFKAVNDRFGHDAGDAVLRSFSDFLRARFHRGSDTLSHERMIHEASEEKPTGQPVLSRWAGDEFAFTFSLDELDADDRRGRDPQAGKPLSVAQKVETEIEHLRTALAEFVALPENATLREIGFDIAVGSAYWDPEKPISADELFTIVDQNMFDRKEAGKAEAWRQQPIHKRLARWVGHSALRIAGAPAPR